MLGVKCHPGESFEKMLQRFTHKMRQSKFAKDVSYKSHLAKWSNARQGPKAKKNKHKK